MKFLRFFFSKIIIRITQRGVGSSWIMERSVYLGSWFWWLLWPFHSKVKVISSSKSKKKFTNKFLFFDIRVKCQVGRRSFWKKVNISKKKRLFYWLLL